MKEQLKYFSVQALYLILAFVLMITPFFVAKWNMPTHYVFSFLSFTVLLLNVFFSKRKVLPIIILVVGVFFIVAYLNQAKRNKAESDMRMEELYRSMQR